MPVADQRLDPGLDQTGRWRRGDDRHVFWQAFALRGVEDGEAFEERDGLGFLTGLASAILRVIGYEPVGIDDRRATLALSDIAAECQGLAKGEPALAGKAMLDYRTPEDQDVDPGVAPTCGGVVRHGERAFAAAVPQGWTQGTRPASSSAMILLVMSS